MNELPTIYDNLCFHFEIDDTNRKVALNSQVAIGGVWVFEQEKLESEHEAVPHILVQTV